MRTSLFLTLAFVLLPIARAADAPRNVPKDDIRDELKKLQGSWTPSAVTLDGKKLADEDLKASGGSLAIKDGGATLTLNGKTRESKLKIDPTKKPKTLDFGDKNAALGIYVLDGDTLTICYDPRGKTRPMETVSREGSGFHCITYKRN